MLQTGKVVSADNGIMEVCFERPEACAHCGACGHKAESLVQIPGDAKAGSRIEVDRPEKQVLKASLLAYVIPLLLLLAGIALGSLIFEQQALSAVTGLLLMAASFFILRWIDKKTSRNAGWAPRVVKVIEENEE